jgi:hypothetical protein
VGLAIGTAVLWPNQFWCLRESQLVVSGWRKPSGQFVFYMRRLLSIIGDLDSVGGHLCRRKLGWAYMALPGTDRHVEEQQIADFETEGGVAGFVRAALDGGQRWTVRANNPHDWIRYVDHNAERVRQWLLG